MRIKNLIFGILPLLLLSLSFLTWSCETSPDEATVRENISEANEAFAQAFQNEDLETILNLYAPNARLYPPNQELVSGVEEIANYWRLVRNEQFNQLDLETISVQTAGSIVNEIGQYRFYDASGEEIDQGKYVTVWIKLGDDWRKQENIWNTSIPVPVVEEEVPTDESVSMKE